MGLTENIQACLRDFLAGTASMARKRHLASTARGFCGFCLMTLVTTGLIRPIRLIRGRNKPILRRTALQAAFVVGYLYPRALPPVTHSSAFQAPECLRDTIRGRIPSRGQGFILVYRLAMDVKTRKGDGGAD